MKGNDAKNAMNPPLNGNEFRLSNIEPRLKLTSIEIRFRTPPCQLTTTITKNPFLGVTREEIIDLQAESPSSIRKTGDQRERERKEQIARQTVAFYCVESI